MKSITSKTDLSDHHRSIITVLTLPEAQVVGGCSGIFEDMFTPDNLK